MKMVFKHRSRVVISAVGISLSVGMVAAETQITNPNDEINKHFAVASKLFGKDQVQLHAFQDGADGSRHKVYSFNCADRMYSQVFDGDVPPDNFPVENETSSMETFDQNSAVAPLAAHACEQHGVPLLGFEW